MLKSSLCGVKKKTDAQKRTEREREEKMFEWYLLLSVYVGMHASSL